MFAVCVDNVQKKNKSFHISTYSQDVLNGSVCFVYAYPRNHTSAASHSAAEQSNYIRVFQVLFKRLLVFPRGSSDVPGRNQHS